MIFVDGCSEDGTRERLLEACREHRTYRLVRSITNRATQWNAGAEAANGDVLVFLHTEAVLSRQIIPEILRVLHTSSAGYFPISYQSGGFFLWWTKFLTNRRARKGYIAGEQGLFITRNCFYDSGMYPEVNFLEDLQFAGELKKCGITAVPASIPLVLSNNKYRQDPSLQSSDARTLNRLRKRFINGESPASMEAEFDVLRSRWYPTALPAPAAAEALPEPTQDLAGEVLPADTERDEGR